MNDISNMYPSKYTKVQKITANNEGSRQNFLSTKKSEQSEKDKSP